ncbi:MAG: GNAT family N-acetyltransferase [Patulibacter sp.]|nr:GNAT family N-acetyltransferase [Patulibacter sp.]
MRRPGSPSPPDGVRVLDETEREAAAAAWAAVAARAGAGPLMASWTWIDRWLAHYGAVVPHRFVVVDGRGGPDGVALLTVARRRRGPFTIRQLHVGTSAEPPGEETCAEHVRVLAVPDREEHVHRALAAVVRADRGWDELVVEASTDPAVAQAVARATWRGRLRVDAQPSRHHDLRTAAADADLASVLASGPRRRLRASLRAFEARGALTIDWPEDAAGALAILDELVVLHQRRWTAAGESGSFASTRFLGFHRDLVAHLVPTGQAAVVRVRCGSETVACVYGLIDGDTLLFYQSGVADYDDNRLRPGLVAHAVFMDACRSRGLERYDFLAGDYRYKRELATGETTLHSCVVQRPRLRLRALEVARDVRDRHRARSDD